jgi:hypothetical protein
VSNRSKETTYSITSSARVLRVHIAEKVLERLATSDRTTIVIEKQPEGKMRVTSGSWDSEKVFLKDQVLEVRHAIRRRLATCGSQNQALRRLGPAL